MFVQRDLIRFQGYFFKKSRRSRPVSLLRADCSQERVSNEKDVGQRRGHEHAVAVLHEPAVAHLAETEDALDEPDPRSDRARATAGGQRRQERCARQRRRP
jgi:hypothetical protein